jgi:hypothetical protein
MSKVLRFPRPDERRPEPDRSLQEPSVILPNIAALLSRVESLQIQTTDDLRLAMFMLELANMCIRLIVGQIRNGPTRIQLLAQSAKISQLLETARCGMQL